MNISKDKVVSIHYTLTEEGGKELENNRDALPMTYLHGHGNLMSALESELEGLEKGASKTVSLQARDAYGERSENAVQRVPQKHLLGKYKRLMPGMIVRVNTNHGARSATVVKAGKFNVDLDMNHPLAGKNLVFNVEVADIREATAEELQHGHAHGPGGHHH